MGQCVSAYTSRNAGGRHKPLVVTMTGHIHLTIKIMILVKRIETIHLTGPHMEVYSVSQWRQATSLQRVLSTLPTGRPSPINLGHNLYWSAINHTERELDPTSREEAQST